MTIWEAAEAAYQQRLQEEADQAALNRQLQIQRAREQLADVVGPDVTLPPHNLIHDLGVVIHDGERGLLFTEQAGAKIVRYVVRDGQGIEVVGEPVRSLADLGRYV